MLKKGKFKSLRLDQRLDYDLAQREILIAKLDQKSGLGEVRGTLKKRFLDQVVVD